MATPKSLMQSLNEVKSKEQGESEDIVDESFKDCDHIKRAMGQAFAQGEDDKGRKIAKYYKKDECGKYAEVDEDVEDDEIDEAKMTPLDMAKAHRAAAKLQKKYGNGDAAEKHLKSADLVLRGQKPLVPTPRNMHEDVVEESSGKLVPDAVANHPMWGAFSKAFGGKLPSEWTQVPNQPNGHMARFPSNTKHGHLQVKIAGGGGHMELHKDGSIKKVKWRKNPATGDYIEEGNNYHRIRAASLHRSAAEQLKSTNPALARKHVQSAKNILNGGKPVVATPMAEEVGSEEKEVVRKPVDTSLDTPEDVKKVKPKEGKEIELQARQPLVREAEDFAEALAKVRGEVTEEGVLDAPVRIVAKNIGHKGLRKKLLDKDIERVGFKGRMAMVKGKYGTDPLESAWSRSRARDHQIKMNKLKAKREQLGESKSQAAEIIQSYLDDTGKSLKDFQKAFNAYLDVPNKGATSSLDGYVRLITQAKFHGDDHKLVKALFKFTGLEEDTMDESLAGLRRAVKKTLSGEYGKQRRRLSNRLDTMRYKTAVGAGFDRSDANRNADNARELHQRAHDAYSAGNQKEGDHLTGSAEKFALKSRLARQNNSAKLDRIRNLSARMKRVTG